MKLLRTIALSGALALGAFSAVTYTACSKDACKDVTCQNGGTCVDGNCSCPTGYEGKNCETKITAKFLGQWAAKEDCNSTSYTVTIAADANDNTKLLVTNLGNYGCTVGGVITFSGLVTSSNTAQFTIMDTKCGTDMTATGSLAANGVLTVSYKAVAPGINDNCIATLTK